MIANVSPPVACVIALLLFLTPGFAVSSFFKPPSAAKHLSTALVFSSLLGYVAFWIFFLNPNLGKLFGAACMASSFAVIGFRVSKDGDSRNAFRQLAVPLVVNILVVVLYSAVLNIVPFARDQPSLANEYFFRNWSDNLFPNVFAERLFEGQDARLLFGGWHSSERPPLQAGVLLLLGIPYTHAGVWYQAVGTAVESTWVIAMFLLAEVLLVSRAAARRLFLFPIFSGFFFVQTVFTWPKMFGGALTIVSLCLFFISDLSKSQGRRHFYLAIIAAGCAWEAHGSTGFALPALGLSAAIGIRRSPWEPRVAWDLLRGVAAIATMLLPWVLYKHYYDREATDALAKYHLALSGGELSLGTTILNAYAAHPFWEVVERKLNSVRMLFTGYLPYEEAPIGWRRLDYYHLFHALGLLNVGWLVFIYNRRSKELKKVLPALTVGLIVTIFWIFGEFGATTREIVSWAQQAFNPVRARNPVFLCLERSYPKYVKRPLAVRPRPASSFVLLLLCHHTPHYGGSRVWPASISRWWLQRSLRPS